MKGKSLSFIHANNPSTSIKMKPKPKLSKICLAILSLTHVHWVEASVSPYSTEEKAALEKFRPLVQPILYRDYMHKDQFLIRYLRAKDLDIDKARSMLGKAIKWRLENKIDGILNETILEFPVTPYYNDGFAYSFSPAFSFNIGAIEMKSLISSGKRAVLLRYLDQFYEIQESGVRYWSERFPSVHGVIGVWDFRTYNLREQGCLRCIWVFQEWLRHYENYYPQLIETSLLVNAPRIVNPLLNAIKPLMSQHSQQSLVVLLRNKKDWRKEFFKIIPRNQIRKSLGGTKPDYVPCALQDFVCKCKIFLKTAGQGRNTTTSLSAGFRKIDADIC